DEKDNGIWELSHPQHHVSSRVMSWVALERASSLAAELGHVDRAAPWRAAMEAIRAEVLERGWSERMQAFRQEYGRDNVDASSLLVPIFRFLPGDDPRVIAGVDRVAERLTIEGHVHRFDPLDTPGVDDKPMGELEGSFLLCT